MLLLIVSFIAGVLTVLAPCILPLLPVIVGGSFTGDINKKKTFTIVASLGISVIAFTLLLKVSTLFITIPESTWTFVSGGIILILGLITLFPSLWENKILNRLTRQSNALMNAGDQKNSFWGNVLVGASLGPVFSTCSPTYFIILATVLPVRPLVGIVYLLSYTIGLCLSLFFVTYIGQKIINKLGVVADPKGIFKKVLGVIFILVGLGILTGVDKIVQTKIVDAGFFDVTKIEQGLLQKNMQKIVGGEIKKAPELAGIEGYINTEGKPITLADYKGKVVLLDIWTYSCINCKRTIPYIKEWYAKYKDQGFVVIGVHTPEFAFEKVPANVQKAVKEFGIEYPVVLDNAYDTWNAFGNQYWPRKYLIDGEGNIIYDHIGEGGYEEFEMQIQKALNVTKPITTLAPADTSGANSPETYFGSSRNEFLANGKSGVSGIQTFTLPKTFSTNNLYLGGTWNFSPEYAENTSMADIVFPYDSKNVYMTAGSDAGVEVEIYNDDALVKTVMIKDETLYTLIENENAGKHTLHIKIPKKGLKAFTFTFG
ncbi:MAG: redoxin family protein [Patescibacteria group bacterium]